MKKRLLLFSMVLSVAVISCSKDDSTTTPNVKSENIFKISSDKTELQKSVKKDEAGVIGITLVSSGKSEQEVANIAMEEVATIEPPVLDGNPMRANHVDIDGNYAYVAYTKERNTYLGGIDIIDISDKFNPVVTDRAVTDQADINALYYKNGNIYFVGAINKMGSSDRTILGKVSTSNGQFTSNVIIKELIGQAGVDVFPVEDKVIALSGSNGVIDSYSENSLDHVNEYKSYSDLRSGAYSEGKIVVLSGDSGLLQLNPSNFDLEKTISIPTLAPESKRTISFFGNSVLVSQGGNGVGVYDIDAGVELANLPINQLPDTDIIPSEKVTNAVSTSNGLILMANGAAGFGITKINDNKIIEEEGIANIHGSANYVKAKGDYIFVASGKGGLKILKMSKVNPSTDDTEHTDGTPTSNTGEFASCDQYPVYDGSEWLNVNSHEEKEYRGSATLQGINVNDKLTFCGSLNVNNGVNINSHGEFTMNGALAVGGDLNINAHSVLKIHGSLTVYGNLNLNSGSSIEFIGENNSVFIYGDVRTGNKVTITGNYTDSSNKL